MKFSAYLNRHVYVMFAVKPVYINNTCDMGIHKRKITKRLHKGRVLDYVNAFLFSSFLCKILCLVHSLESLRQVGEEMEEQHAKKWFIGTCGQDQTAGLRCPI